VRLVHTAIRALGKPQYIFRTSQLLKRAARFVRGTKPFETVTLPWKLRIGVDTADTVGNAIAVQGVYDLVTTEVLWRLTSRGDKTIDGGANVGYMTSILAHCAGGCGSVLAFEPHPQVFQRLKSNVGSWTNVAPITLHNFALSDRSGQAILLDVPTHQQNTCWSHLPGWDHRPERLRPGISVELHRLDEFIDYEVGVMKLDVEFHEAQVLEGAGHHLRNIRDIIFEEVGPYPQESHKLLERAGYRIVWFEEHLKGPRIIEPFSRPELRHYDTVPSYLATQDYKRAESLLLRPGWQSLRNG
jgi:FkbM family methyltransferase